MDEPLPFAEPSAVKRCTLCKRLLPLEGFHRNRSRRDGRQNACKPCNIARNQRWYREHPTARAARMDDYAKRRRDGNRARVLAYLRTHPCVDCGETDPVVLDFDHLRAKFRNVSLMVLRNHPWPRILDEIAKCEVVCANCHRRRTAKRAGTYRYRHTTGG